MLGFGKKRKSFASGFSSKYSNANYSKDARRRRILHHRILALKSSLLKFLVLIIFAAAAYLLLFSQAFNVKNIAVSGNKTIEESAVREAVNSVTGRKVLKIFNNNLLIVKTSDVRDAIKNRFNNISSVLVTKKIPQTLKIEIMEKPIDISWCNRIKIERVIEPGKKSEKDSTVPMETAQCYFSDENNAIYEKANDASSGSIKIFRDDRINIGDKIGDDYLKNFVRDLAANFNRKTGLSLNYLYLPPIAERELHLVTGDGWKIYFDLNRNADDQLWILNNVIKSKISDSEKKNLDYIDLRVIDRINYKTK